MLKTWVGMEKPRPIPWAPLKKPLSACRLALISLAGIALKTDQPFDQESERRNPWWGGPSYRILPVDLPRRTSVFTTCTSTRRMEKKTSIASSRSKNSRNWKPSAKSALPPRTTTR